MSIKSRIKDFLNGVQIYEGVRSDELLEVEADHYDSKSTFEVVWGEIYSIYYWMNNPTKENIKKLQNDFEMIDNGHSVRVKIQAQLITASYQKHGHYYTFALEEIKDFYNQIHEKRKRKEEDEIDRKKRKEEELIRNQPEKLAKSIEKILKK
ncbi:hypothetical protein QUF94_14540 [Peribacillus sp. NJ4]|uniref:hypothetical protein n=1 Tax=Peribacillus sp. NJ4 TaxID=3055862 RepID=UPI0025A1A9E2|nr:hypothetical protein [Peribacillus sp. NJ4]MDM5212643.1 hypothetical protein [Peribacillus sp. NJ4]